MFLGGVGGGVGDGPGVSAKRFEVANRQSGGAVFT